MEKDIYQNYDYLPVATTNAVETPHQYFIVQDNKTFLINKVANSENQEVQFVTQVQDIKEVLDGLQTMPSYDMQQPFLVDINNSTDIIMQDQLVLTDEEAGNVFTNGYLLQTLPENTEPATTEVIDEISEDIAEEEPCDVPVESPSTQIADNKLTEITLNEEQYQMLESKGWVLLEVNNRIYLLDNLGLHDITGDEKMLEKFKDDVELKDQLSSYVAASHQDNLIYPKSISKPLEETAYEPDLLNISDGYVEGSKIDLNLQTKIHVNNNIATQPVAIEPDVIDKPPLTTIASPDNNRHCESVKKFTKQEKVLRIKTKLSSKDIPKKIFICKLENGKKLYARVRHNGNCVKRKVPITHRMVVNFSQSKQRKDLISDGSEVEAALNAACQTEVVSCGAEDVGAAEGIVTRLLDFVQLRDLIQGRNLLLTKSQKNEKSTIKSDELVLKYIVCGRVAQFDNTKSTWNFIYVPHLLAQLLQPEECDTFEMSVSGEPLRREHEEREIDNIVHVHITEILCQDDTTHTVVTVTKRDIPLQPVLCEKIQILSEARHACSACAERFTSEQEAMEHQALPCGDNNDGESSLTIDTQKETLPTKFISASNGVKYYACQLCEQTFNRSSNYRRHLLIHSGPNLDESEKNEDCKLKTKTSEPDSLLTTLKPDSLLTTLEPDSLKTTLVKPDIFKCQMCPATYIYSSTLTKHIMKKHII